MMAQNDVSKHVADLVTSGVHTFWCMWSWFYKLTIRLVHEDQLQPTRDLHKGCVPRSFKGIEYFLSQNFRKLNSVQLFFYLTCGKKLQNYASIYGVNVLRQVPVQKTIEWHMYCAALITVSFIIFVHVLLVRYSELSELVPFKPQV